MKKTNKTYFILTYLFFVYPPFISGIVSIYWPRGLDLHITSLIANIILILVIFAVCAILYLNKKIHLPTMEEQRYLLFGFLGNIVVYFYTYQYSLNIERIITVYLILILVLGFYYILIERKLKPIELWILMPIYAIFDYLLNAVRGCGWESSYYCGIANTQYDPFFKVLFFIIVLGTVLYYVYKLVLYRLFDVFKALNIIIIIYLSYAATDFMYTLSDFTLTMMILYPFFVIVDFVVKLVNKTYTHKMLLFYVRTLAIFIVFMSLGTSEFYVDPFHPEILFLLVILTYISLGISILKFILKIDVKDENIIFVVEDFFKGPKYREATEEDINKIKEEYGRVLADHVILDNNSYSLVVEKEDMIIGFISTYQKPLTPPLQKDEAFINVIEVHHEHRNQGIATKLVLKTEHYFKSQGIKQIRAWSSEDKYEAIHLWDKLNYTMNPADIHVKDQIIHGYYVSKKI